MYNSNLHHFVKLLTKYLINNSIVFRSGQKYKKIQSIIDSYWQKEIMKFYLKIREKS